MKHALLLLVLAAVALPLAAQSPVKGSGNVIEQVRPLDRFTAVSIDFVADVQIAIGESPGIELVTDDNILPHIGTRIRGGTLMVSQDRWIAPSIRTRIRITTPMMARLETSGYSTVEVSGVSGPRFAVDAGVGDVKLTGSTSRVRLTTKTGTIDASELKADAAEVTITSRGKVLVDAAELVTELSETATVVYSGQPLVQGDSVGLAPMETYEAAPTPAPERVAFRLRNNRFRWVKLRVEGPAGASFGYGFSLLPRASRAENWPVGTRVFQVNRLGGETLLYTVSAEDRDQTVDLF
ncbi:MAG: DUF4097 family beta strand repeat protein [Rhodothermales bacterium]|nr:DUF4097 family beta strand repeat protein [Rhodothermales bacterium]